MKEQTNDKEIIDEKKLKRNELICGILGLAIAAITFIFLIVKAISFNVEIVEGETVNFSTSAFRILGSDFDLVYGNTGLSYWNLFRQDVNIAELEKYAVIVVACCWISLIGCIASAVLYALFLLGKRFPFFCEMASRCAAIGCGITLLFFIIGEISVSGEKLYATYVSYNLIIPVMYAVVMACALIVISYLCGYSKARRKLLSQARLQKAAENTVALNTTQLQSVQTAHNTSATVETANVSASPLIQQTANYQTDYAAQKKALVAKYISALHSDDLRNFEQAISVLSPDKYNQLIQKSIKKKNVAILLAIFLGGIGVDRFYVGDAKLGVLKIIGTVAAMLCNSVPVLGLIANLANAVWKIADIFFSYKKCYDKNYQDAMAIIGS